MRALVLALGSMRNAGDVARMSSDQGRAAYDDAVVKGITASLGG